jgi:hypothetical protein
VRNEYRCCRSLIVQPHLLEEGERPKRQWSDDGDGSLAGQVPLVEDCRPAIDSRAAVEAQCQPTVTITDPRSPSRCAHGPYSFSECMLRDSEHAEPVGQNHLTQRRSKGSTKRKKGLRGQGRDRVESSFWSLAHRSIRDQSYQDQQWAHCGRVFRSQQANERCSVPLWPCRLSGATTCHTRDAMPKNGRPARLTRRRRHY